MLLNFGLSPVNPSFTTAVLAKNPEGWREGMTFPPLLSTGCIMEPGPAAGDTAEVLRDSVVFKR